jgi:hypothetical protein
MKKLLILVLLAASALADDAPLNNGAPLSNAAPAPEFFPTDYTPSPCAASAASVCQTFPQLRMTAYATALHGYDLHQEWVDAHWDEMSKIILPLCGKIGNCFTVKDNDWVFCLDLMRDEFLGTCAKFPRESEDYDQCVKFSMTYYVGLGAKTQLDASVKECIDALPPENAERSLVASVKEKLEVDYEGPLTIYVNDAETHIPVRAQLTIDGTSQLRSTEGPRPTAGYPSKFRAKLTRVDDGHGHRGVVAPTVTLKATGYKPLILQLPIAIPKMNVTMTPSADQLKPGKNTVTVTAVDADTGKPVYARVMAGELVAGNANKPIIIELEKGKKRPEIWVTSLYDKYADAVIAPAQ